MRCLDQSNNMICALQQATACASFEGRGMAQKVEEEIDNLREQVERLQAEKAAAVAEKTAEDLRRRVMEQLSCKKQDAEAAEIVERKDLEAQLRQELCDQAEKMKRTELENQRLLTECNRLKAELEDSKAQLSQAVKSNETEFSTRLAENQMHAEFHRQTIVDLQVQMESTIEMATRESKKHFDEKQRLSEALIEQQTIAGKLRV